MVDNNKQAIARSFDALIADILHIPVDSITPEQRMAAKDVIIGMHFGFKKYTIKMDEDEGGLIVEEEKDGR